jgi:hypothetical protein
LDIPGGYWSFHRLDFRRFQDVIKGGRSYFKGGLMNKLLLVLLSGSLALMAGCDSFDGTAPSRANQGGSPDLYGDFRPATVPPATGPAAAGPGTPGMATGNARPSVGTGVVVGGPR